jgi:hypothetical protein
MLNKKLTDLVPMPKEVTREMRDIISKIESNVYHHAQESWHCGTSHCFAGFKEVRDYAKHSTGNAALRKKLICDTDIRRYGDNMNAWRNEQCGSSALISTTYDYAKWAWGLTVFEADALFDGSRSLYQIKQMVENFENGLRKVRHCENDFPDDPDFSYAWVKPEDWKNDPDVNWKRALRSLT